MEAGRFKTPEWLILLGGCFFTLVLGVSAVWEADIRWLHFFQAWMYIAAMVLAVRRNRWGYFIGISAAGLWDYTNIFATSFFFNGLQQLAQWIQTGHLKRPDLLIAGECLGVFQVAPKACRRLGLVGSDIRVDHGVLCPGYGDLSTPLSEPFSAAPASAIALVKLSI